LICITCPKGCMLSVTHDGKTVVSVDDNICKRGVKYAKVELSDLRRMVVTTVWIKNGIHPLLPVYLATPFPRPRIHGLLKELCTVELSALVQMGAMVVKDALGTGIDIIASRDMGRVE